MTLSVQLRCPHCSGRTFRALEVSGYQDGIELRVDEEAGTVVTRSGSTTVTDTGGVFRCDRCDRVSEKDELVKDPAHLDTETQQCEWCVDSGICGDPATHEVSIRIESLLDDEPAHEDDLLVCADHATYIDTDQDAVTMKEL